MHPALHSILLDQPASASNDIAQQLASTAREAAQQVTSKAKEVTQAAKDMCHSAATRAEDTLEQSRQYLHENPLPVALGAFTLGLTLGCLLALTRHPEPTLRERFGW